MRKRLAVAVLAAGGAMGAWAQSGKMALGAANDKLLTVSEGEFMGVAKAMPADKYDFTPASLKIPGAKYEGVRTFAAEVKHVAQANFFFYGAVSGMKPDMDVKAIGALKTKDEIVNALAASFAFGHKAMATLTPETEADPVDIDGLKTKGTLAAFAVAHGYDHYGQMVEYLRMSGVTPPGSK